MDNATKNYHKAEILGKSPLELVIKVYDGAIAAYTEAASCYETKDNQAGYDHLQNARKFVTHLYTTLDKEQGGEIAENLGKLYTFMLTQTDLAEATKDVKILRHNVKLLQNLREGWAAISEDDGANQQQLPEESVKEAVKTISVAG